MLASYIATSKFAHVGKHFSGLGYASTWGLAFFVNGLFIGVLLLAFYH